MGGVPVSALARSCPRRFRATRLLAAVVVGFAAVTGGVLSTTVPAAGSVPSGFQEAIVYGALTEPTTLRFARDGRVFVAEKSGLIKLFDSLSDRSPTVFADLRTQVHNYWDRGLLGLELDPQFPENPWV
ncbi:MAG: PQQ-dependent sugar dehydrogenase [Acidimicrobiales bacterium]